MTIKKEQEKRYCKYCACYIRRNKNSMFYDLSTCNKCIKDPANPEKAIYDKSIADQRTKMYQENAEPFLKRSRRSRAKEDAV